MKTRHLSSPWPFLFSVVNGSIVRNVQPKVKRAPRARLKRVPPSNRWTQEALL